MKTKKGFSLRPLGKEYILVAEGLEASDFNRMISMNETSAFLWKEVENKEFDADVLANLLVEHWEVDPETAKKDTNALVKSWKDANLLDE